MSQELSERPKSPATWLIFQRLVLANMKKKIKVQRYSPIATGIHRWPVDSPHKRQVIHAYMSWRNHISFRIVASHALLGVHLDPIIPQLHNVQDKALCLS